MNEKQPIVQLVDVQKFYGDNHVVKNCNLDIMPGEFLTLLGPSGCGKTTTLRMISGFEKPTYGEVRLGGQNVDQIPPFKRNVNTVFQNYALFPNMNVADNVAYGLKVRKRPKSEIKKRVTEMLKLVQLEGFEKRKIAQMSGGQKQRVAIARALINEPKVLLLDEPLGALDRKLRKQMQIELKQLQKKLGITFVFVTHDQEEALTMSDRIAVINEGEIQQLDTPQKIYDEPATRFVADFIGESNIIDAVAMGEDGDFLKVGTENGQAISLMADSNIQTGDAVSVAVRPQNMQFSLEPVDHFSIKGVVSDHIFMGHMIKMIVKLNDGSTVRINRFGEDELAPVGQVVNLYWEPGKSRTFRNKSWFKTNSVVDLQEAVDEANATHF